MMTVAEAIAELQKFDPSLPIDYASWLQTDDEMRFGLSTDWEGNQYVGVGDL